MRCHRGMYISECYVQTSNKKSSPTARAKGSCSFFTVGFREEARVAAAEAGRVERATVEVVAAALEGTRVDRTIGALVVVLVFVLTGRLAPVVTAGVVFFARATTGACIAARALAAGPAPEDIAVAGRDVAGLETAGRVTAERTIGLAGALVLFVTADFAAASANGSSSATIYCEPLIFQ
jgi:hypothetical protein